jgi:hypothetical protein
MIVGVSDHNGWVVLVTVASDGRLVDRRRVTLVGEGLPSMPHHHDAQGLQLDQALDLVERVRVSASHHAKLGLAAVASAVPSGIRGVALRRCPPLPATVAERLASYRADSVMYRHALAAAAEERGWVVHWYDAKKVIDAARDALAVEDFDACFQAMRRSLGPPWDKDHKIAMAAAIVAARSRPT